MLDREKHQIHLVRILTAFYKDSYLSNSLGFKGGTASYLFYNLPRFSVDLDFDLVPSWSNFNNTDKEMFLKKITNTLSADYKLVDKSLKFSTLFWLVSYEKTMRKIKIEVSTRKMPNTYEIKNYYGTSMRILTIGDIIAHKLTAILDRKEIANRDLFDAYYFLKSKYASEINYEIVRFRTGKSPSEFYSALLKRLGSVNNKNILSGLGEVLDTRQKDWVKQSLLKELKEAVRFQRDLMSKTQENRFIKA